MWELWGPMTSPEHQNRILICRFLQKVDTLLLVVRGEQVGVCWGMRLYNMGKTTWHETGEVVIKPSVFTVGGEGMGELGVLTGDIGHASDNGRYLEGWNMCYLV